ncbi:MAG TPA: nucleotide sugar dehydrogenase [Solirubrobacterales bacterium]|nr:nucleotide sugar dehydrogenase [Solirubrobacterales bacterium]
MRIGVIGLGYVGLPLAVAFAEAGHDVVCFDVDEERVEALGAGRSYVEDVGDEILAPLRDRLHPTTDAAELGACEAVVICVPTPLTDEREPDLSYLEAAGETLAAQLRSEQLVVLESTTYPGTTRERLAPILERGSGLAAGADFHLAFSPERIDPGRTDFTVRTTPKLVGGVSEASTERARALYAEICDEVVVLSSPEAAELAKLLENVFRSVNIAFVNELAQLCDRLGIDVWEVIDAAATKPFGFMRFDPGPGMGGHCLPIDPFYLAFKARENDFDPAFIELAGKVNQAQPAYCVERIERALAVDDKPVAGARVLILGASYKGGVGDVRESPALKIIGRLQDMGAEVSYHDPFVPQLPGHGLASVELEPALAATDLAAIVTAHPGVDYEQVVAAAACVIDFRNVTKGIEAENLTRL